MRIIYAFLPVLFLAGLAGAQAPDTLWTSTFGGSSQEQCFDCVITPDGGFAMVGYTRSYGAGGDDLWLVKADSNGNLMWDKTFGGSSSDRGYSLCLTADGGLIIGGWTFSSGPGQADIWVLKTDSNGNLEWEKTFGTQNGFERCYDIIQDNDGSYVLVGETDNDGTTYVNIWLLKIDQTGNLLWEQQYGGTHDDYGLCVTENSSNGYAVAGWAYNGSGYVDLHLLTTDPAGNLIDEELIGGSGSDYCRALTQLPDGSYLVAGETSSTSSGNFDGWLVKTQSDCTPIWETTYGSDDEDDFISSMQVLSDGRITLCGTTTVPAGTSEDLWLLLTDESGSQTWETSFGGSGGEYGNALVITYNGALVSAGYTTSFGAGSSDFWLLKTEECLGLEQEEQGIPGNLQVLSVGPNPFTTQCRVTVGCNDELSATIHSLDGRMVRQLQTSSISAGMHELYWDGRNGEGAYVPQGVYLLRVIGGGEVASVKLYRISR